MNRAKLLLWAALFLLLAGIFGLMRSEHAVAYVGIDCYGDCDSPADTDALPDSILDKINPTFKGTFTIEVDWDATLPAFLWPLSPDSFPFFANAVFPESLPIDPISSPAHFIANHWGYDSLSSYSGIELAGYDDFKIVVSEDDAYSRASGNRLILALSNSLPHRNVSVLVFDAFAHEFQHIASQSLPWKQDPTDLVTYKFGRYPSIYDSTTACQGRGGDGTTEFFSKASEWLYTDSIVGGHEFSQSGEVPLELGLGRDDYWERCKMDSTGKGHTRYLAYGLFAAYLQEHFEFSSGPSEDDLLYQWRRYEYDASGTSYRSDMWALADVLAGTGFSSHFSSWGGSPRLRELYQEFALSLWCNSPEVDGSASIWVDGKSPRDEFGLFSDWTEWCASRSWTEVFYSRLESSSLSDTTTLGPIISSTDYPDGCGDGDWERLVHIDTYTFLPLPFVAEDGLVANLRDTTQACGQLAVDLDFYETYACIKPNTCSPEIDESTDSLSVDLDGNDVLHIYVLGYPTGVDTLDQLGDEAQILFAYEDSDFESVSEIGDNGKVHLEVPCFGTEYRSVVLLMTLTELSASEKVAYARTLPFTYSYWVEVLDNEDIEVDTEWANCACLNSSFEIDNATLRILPGTKVQHADGPMITVSASDSLVIGSEGSDQVQFEPIRSGGYWGGVTVYAPSGALLADSTDFGRLEDLIFAQGLGAGPTLAEVSDCRMELKLRAGFGSNGIDLSSSRDVVFEGCEIENSLLFQLSRSTELRDVKINTASNYSGAAIKIPYDATLDNVRIANARIGIACYGASTDTVRIGDSDTGNGVRGLTVSGRDSSLAGSTGLMLTGSPCVEVRESEFHNLDVGISVDDTPSLLLRSSKIDSVYIGVDVANSSSSVDLGDATLGDNCIDSADERVFNGSANTVSARNVFWGDSPPDSSWFYGSVDFADFLAECPAGAGGPSFFFGRQAPPEIGPFVLASPYPNPFNPRCYIEFSLPGDGARSLLAIYDVSGRLVRTLFEGKADGSSRQLIWDGADGRGKQASSGVYFARLQSGTHESSFKLVLLR